MNLIECKTCFILLIILLFIFDPAYAQTARKILNESGLRYSRKTKWNGICYGDIHEAAGLEDVEIYEANMKTGVRCTTGDVDGNGYLDFTYYGKKKER